MRESNEPDRFEALLAPLYDAGWARQRAVGPGKLFTVLPRGIHRVLRRSCLVIGVSYDIDEDDLEHVALLPIADQLVQPDDELGVHDAVDGTVDVWSHLDDMTTDLSVAFADEGLLDPTRFRLPSKDPIAHVALLTTLYYTYVSRIAARWRGGYLPTALKAMDGDSTLRTQLRACMFLAPNVIPDPVPMAAAIGITLDCWRNTELETLHASTHSRFTDLVMAKLNIATTRAVRDYITTAGIDWSGIGGVLLDAERAGGNNAGDSIADLTGAGWPALAASIEAKLARWEHIEQLAGPEATLRLASVMGSTDYTSRWWGNGWWRAYARNVLNDLQDRYPARLPRSSELGPIDHLDALTDWPDEMPDDDLAFVVDPPNHHGLRHADLPELPARRLTRQTKVTGRTRAA
jgi:hypothetical protein